ncbi:histidine phosphatase family protein [Streptomyces tsukubensis]|uniref:Histidine phosphatase family protein n=1 Tax=Streptomyces tsukubensis TaxID=83656 RepID=A0A1V4A7J8_9ACTN|nr:histidine phosphatase family protein [Streptomyces tsukubensis]OON77315.1 histidine phosphatase family protein [Streptomyces tsukubensis]QFR92390.1 histidine phosphatase family protein [Streptomyces tsukubensis]
MRLLLVRHGQTPSNVSHSLDTAAPGPRLTGLGEKQAAALPAALAAEDIGVLYASPLIRTQLTAAPLATERGLEVRVRPGIAELTAGDLEMRSDKEAAAQYLRVAFAWSAGDTALRMPGGESGEEALARYDEVVSEAAATGAGTAVLVSHGAAIRMWTAARAANVTVEFAMAHALDNTGVVVLEGAPGSGWHALTWAGKPLGPAFPAPGDQDAGPAGRPLQP